MRIQKKYLYKPRNTFSRAIVNSLSGIKIALDPFSIQERNKFETVVFAKY